VQKKNNEEESEEDMETYTWGEETRVRSTGNITPSESINGDILKKNPKDEDSVLDMEEQEAHYGQNQYTESDLISPADEAKENKVLRQRVTANQSPRTGEKKEAITRQYSNGSTTTTSPNAEQIDELDTIIQRTFANSPSKDTNSIIIESLKEKIRQLQKFSTIQYKCLICLDQYQVPLVSVNCWHAHCEKCWLTCLGTKRLCPQCNTITSPQDLRRIYI